MAGRKAKAKVIEHVCPVTGESCRIVFHNRTVEKGKPALTELVVDAVQTGKVASGDSTLFDK